MARTPDDDTQPPAWTGPVRDPSPVVQWIGWHLGELAVVTALAALAITVDAWFTVLAALAVGAWTARELQQRRQRRELAAARDRRHVTARTDKQDDDRTDRTEASA